MGQLWIVHFLRSPRNELIKIYQIMFLKLKTLSPFSFANYLKSGCLFHAVRYYFPEHWHEPQTKILFSTGTNTTSSCAKSWRQHEPNHTILYNNRWSIYIKFSSAMATTTTWISTTTFFVYIQLFYIPLLSVKVLTPKSKLLFKCVIWLAPFCNLSFTTMALMLCHNFDTSAIWGISISLIHNWL